MQKLDFLNLQSSLNYFFIYNIHNLMLTAHRLQNCFVHHTSVPMAEAVMIISRLRRTYLIT